jgi:hypothetical protein
MAGKTKRNMAGWEVWVGVFIALGMAATIGLAVFETYWG